MNTNNIKYLIPKNITMGIYIITAPDGHYYIGSSKNLKIRYNSHCSNLRRGHECSRIRRIHEEHPDWIWTFELLEKVEQEKQLYNIENNYLKMYVGLPLCLNITCIITYDITVNNLILKKTKRIKVIDNTASYWSTINQSSYQKNKEKNKERDRSRYRSYYQKNKEKNKSRLQSYYQKNKELYQSYYQKNRERIIKQHSEYNKKRKEASMKNKDLPSLRSCVDN